MTTHEPWDVREPATVLGEVLRHGRPQPGDVLVALLGRADDPAQQVATVVRIHRGARPPRMDASELLRKHAEALTGHRPWVDGRWMPPAHVLVTVVCRSGRVIPGPDELFWLRGWRYSNHLAAAYNGDVYLVTDHGWTGCMDRRAGFTPALHPRPMHPSVQGPSAQER